MKNRNLWDRLGDFVLGKGFYIVLFLCVAAIGISGYYLVRTMNTIPGTPEDAEPAGGNPSVVLPDSEAKGPEPAGGGSVVSGTAPGGTAANRAEHTPRVPSAVQTAPEPAEDGDPEPAGQVSAPVEDIPAGQPEPADELPTAFSWPVRGELLRDFSLEVLSPDPTLGDWRTHNGLDVASSLGDNVLALAGGTVTRVYDDGLMGTTVMIEHGGGLVSLCCGLAEEPPVAAGDQVEAGAVIGSVGDTALAESGLPAHVHVETWLDGIPTDPRDFLPEI